MHNCVRIADDLFYLGGNDRRIALFESAYPVPRGVSYNSYLLTDEKTVLLHHMEPDHSATFARVLEKYPSATVVTNQKVAQMLKNYFGFAGEVRLVKEGDTLSVGKRTLSFVFAPMVHWPEVMFTYIPEDGTLFSADAFGTFGALPGSVFADEVDFERDFLDDARRYYFNIVGKYGVQVQNVLKKAAGLEIKLVCPLHGPVWRKNFAWYLQKYLTWSAYEPEEKCAAVFYASVYGHTQNAAEIVASAIAQAGAKAKCYDVSVTHVSELIAEAFRCSHVVFASTTYNNGVFVNMENFLNDLKAHNFQNRKYALVENGSWAPQAGSLMDGFLSAGKNMEKIGEKVTVLSAVSEGSAQSLRALGKLIAEDMQK